eukprot:CAMPEP_0172660028 /NCGR_PEP_ID=MMETSP1074-20121228/3850_1 /TAXON_ID=2916 /ORGANISM="Ceratium fusus, Strain PA161109" /LENGTH=531 /DNA_ID=CAMNT_0013475627 /DNA_START=107 /DNA_END=1702 /DNA_ORIENTATION=+
MVQTRKAVSKMHVSEGEGLLHKNGDLTVVATSSEAWAHNLFLRHSSRSAHFQHAQEKATQALQAMKDKEKNLLAQRQTTPAPNLTAHHENSSAHYEQKLLDANATQCRECGNAEEALVAATKAALTAHTAAQTAAAFLGLAAKNYAIASQGFAAANKEYTQVVNQMCPITLTYNAAGSAFASLASAAQDLKQKAVIAQQHKAWEIANKTVVDTAQSQYDTAAARATAAEQPIAAKKATAAAACASIVTPQAQFLLTGVVSAGRKNAPVNVVTITESSVKFATNRDKYKLKNIPSDMFGSFYVQADHYKATGEQKFTTNRPVVVYVTIDSRGDANLKALPDGFTRYGSLAFDHGFSPGTPDFTKYGVVDFPMYKKAFPPGTHSFQFRFACAAAWFVQEAPTPDLCGNGQRAVAKWSSNLKVCGGNTCPSGWHKCTGQDVMSAKVTYTWAKSFSGCYNFDAAHDCGGCSETCTSRKDVSGSRKLCYDASTPDKGGMGSGCYYDNPQRTSCLTGGRIDAGRNCGATNDGVVCCQ